MAMSMQRASAAEEERTKKILKDRGFFLVVELVVGLGGMKKECRVFWFFLGGDLDLLVEADFLGIVRVLGAFFWSSFLTFYQRSSCFDEMTLVDFESVVM